MTAIATYLHNCWITWNEFWAAFHLFRRIDDLTGLARWAKRKRLKGPYQTYRYKLTMELLSLQGRGSYYPNMTWWAHRAYCFSKAIAPTSHYYRKGSAAAYRKTR